MLNEVFGTGYVRFVVAFCIPCLLWLLCGSGIIKFFKKWQRGHNNVREYLDQNETKKNNSVFPCFIYFSYFWPCFRACGILVP